MKSSRAFQAASDPPGSTCEPMHGYSPQYYIEKTREAVRAVMRGLRNFRTVSLRAAQPSQGNVLISYLIDHFLVDPAKVPVTHPIHWHTNSWESWQMAQTFLDLGYNVDVICWMNRMFIPTAEYSVFIDVRHNMERLTPFLDPACLKIQHLDCAHLSFLNAAESRRLLELQQRRGFTLLPRRLEPPNLGIEHADCATILGNRFTAGTYAYSGKTLYPLPLPSAARFAWPEEKDWTACSRNYIWLGSGGLVHKGLDLVLEAFAGMPDFHLFVCGPVNREPDFERAFHRELYETANITTLGWVDTGSEEFRQLTLRCAGLVYPSCSEGQCGGVITAMHAGLIPVVSVESGVDVDEFGMLLPSSSVATIQAAALSLASLKPAVLESMARGAWETARSRYTRENYQKEYRSLVETLLKRVPVPHPVGSAASCGVSHAV